ncbi:MAG: ankyrin repeat domain-containing protein [Halobacteriovoraceae bacterium]|nr:ankyrin repeat domain-containing protein [Halobacteriovoraceae bacterium]
MTLLTFIHSILLLGTILSLYLDYKKNGPYQSKQFTAKRVEVLRRFFFYLWDSKFHFRFFIFLFYLLFATYCSRFNRDYFNGISVPDYISAPYIFGTIIIFFVLLIKETRRILRAPMEGDQKLNKMDIDSFFLAARNGDYNKIKNDLENGIGIDQVDSDGETALLTAISEGHMPIVNFLLERGASRDRIATDGTTFLHAAVMSGKVECTSLALGDAYLLESKDSDGYTPLHLATIMKEEEVFSFLVTRNANINSICNKGWSILHSASDMGLFSIVQVLIDHQVDMDVRTPKGNLPIDLAQSSGHINIVELLKPFYIK